MEILRWISDVCFVFGVGIFTALSLGRLKKAGAFDGLTFLLRFLFTWKKPTYAAKDKKTDKGKISRATKFVAVCGAVCILISLVLLIALKKAYYA